MLSRAKEFNYDIHPRLRKKIKIGSVEAFVIGNLELLNPNVSLSWIGVRVRRLTRHVMKSMFLRIK